MRYPSKEYLLETRKDLARAKGYVSARGHTQKARIARDANLPKGMVDAFFAAAEIWPGPETVYFQPLEDFLEGLPDQEGIQKRVQVAADAAWSVLMTDEEGQP